MKAERLDHIHIYVKDLDQAIRFFSEVLGTKFIDLGESKKFALKGAFCPLGLELLQPTSMDSVVGRVIERRGEGVAGISFKVPSVEEASTEMQSRGIRTVSKSRGPGVKEIQFHPKDCHGVMIEFAEYEEQHPCMAATLLAKQPRS